MLGFLFDGLNVLLELFACRYVGQCRVFKWLWTSVPFQMISQNLMDSSVFFIFAVVVVGTLLSFLFKFFFFALVFPLSGSCGGGCC